MLLDKKSSCIYFASDLHLGAPNYSLSLEREKRFIHWLNTSASNAQAIYLVGDIFDFWFEYKYSIPQNYVRLLGKLASLVDNGTKVHFFTGNHDLWVSDYLSREIGLQIHQKELITTIAGKRFYIAHGDGLGPGDYRYKCMKSIFLNSFFKWCFKWLHPDIGISIATYWSKKSRQNQGKKQFLGVDKEWLVLHAKEILKKESIDFFIFGHRHIPIDIPIGKNARYINLGDWIDHYTYAVFDGNQIELKTF